MFIKTVSVLYIESVFCSTQEIIKAELDPLSTEMYGQSLANLCALYKLTNDVTIFKYNLKNWPLLFEY